jgi:formate C-acetyltransferase
MTTGLESLGYTSHYLDGWLEAEGEPPAVREAMGRHRLYTRAPVFVEPGELVTGSLFRATGNEPVANQVSAHHLHRPVIDAILASPAVSETDKAGLREKLERIAPTVVANAFPASYTDEERAASEAGTALCAHFNGHQVLDYPRLLGCGLGGLRDDVRTARARAGGDPDGFYRALEITLDGMSAYIRRHGEMAASLLRAGAAGASGRDPAALAAIRDTCLTVSSEAPRTFPQAVQLTWFGMMFGDYDSFGRLDQYLAPFFTGEEEARPWLAALWRKVEEHGAIINMTVGGCRPDGSDGVNVLTCLALRTTRELGNKSPNLCLRITADAPEELWREVHQSLGTGQSLPALYNDDLVVPLLERQGIATEDARDYCLAGCSQVVIPGRSHFTCDIGVFNSLKCLELALHDGLDPRTGRQAGPRTGKARDLATLDAVLDAWKAQVRHAVRIGTALADRDNAFRKDYVSCVRSLLTADCLQRGRGIFRGGARYNAVQHEIVGLTNTADSLAGIQAMVFESRALDLEALVGILDRDFADREDVRRALLERAPKFGNDDDRVDRLRVEVSRFFYDEVRARPATLGGFHWPGEVIFSYHADLAPFVGASADGRPAFTPLADSAGPAQGTDRHGPTAVLASMLKLPLDRCLTCCSLNLKFTPLLWNGNPDAIVHLLRGYFARGGYQLQVNVVDRRVLEEARRNPQAHRGLVVRVGGFSAWFTRLEPVLQEEIIRRTGHDAV